MIKELICITCPNSCHLKIDEELSVTGNMCNRGINFARNELQNPKRSLTTTVKTNIIEYPVVSVRTNGVIPKNKVFTLIELLDKIVIDKYLPIGSVILRNVFDSGTDIITTTNMVKQGES